METLRLALEAWREADRRIQEAGLDVTPEMVQQLAAAKRRYQESAAQLRGESPELPPDQLREAAVGGREAVAWDGAAPHHRGAGPGGPISPREERGPR